MVTGATAAITHDFNTLVDHYTPIVFAFVLGLSFLLLMVAFRSIVVPAKAIIMNLLSVGAAYGLIVLVFQKGYGADSSASRRCRSIESWLPLFLFCVLFGLSMDYHVFLLSRIREHYDLTGDNQESVAVGLQSTAKIITGAALIMVVVFAGFAAGRLVLLQQVGLRPGGRRPARRDDRPLDPGAGQHGAAGRPQLVLPEVVELVAARHHRGTCPLDPDARPALRGDQHSGDD